MIGAEEEAILTAQRKLGMANERTQQLLTNLLRPIIVPANKLNNPMRLTNTGVTSSSSIKSALPRPFAESQESFPVPRLTRPPGWEIEIASTWLSAADCSELLTLSKTSSLTGHENANK